MNDYWVNRAKNIFYAYGAVVLFKNFQGDPIPEWEALPPLIKEAWLAAAKRSQIDAANFLMNQTLDVATF